MPLPLALGKRGRQSSTDFLTQALALAKRGSHLPHTGFSCHYPSPRLKNIWFYCLFFPEARDVCREVRMSDERAGFREAESEEQIEQDFLAGEIAA